MINFIFVNNMTEERLEILADDMEAAEAELLEHVEHPQHWRTIRSDSEDPIGLFNPEDYEY